MKYHVLSPVEHDGARYEEGSQVAMAEDSAAALLAAGVLQAMEAVASEARKSRGEG